MTEEDSFIRQKEKDDLHNKRRQQQLEALRTQEREGIAEVLDTTEELADEALALGFDESTAAILPMVPLIEVAWADGKVTDREASKVLEIAEKRGIQGKEALGFLELLLEKKPSSVFFERTNRVLARILNESPEDLAKRDVIEQARAVADASGGFLGLGNRISDVEKKALDELADLFELKS